MTGLLTACLLWSGFHSGAHAKPHQRKDQNSPVQSSGTEASRLCIRVFFATTRRWDGQGFTSERGNGTSHDFGQAAFCFDRQSCTVDVRDFAQTHTPTFWTFVSSNSTSGVGVIEKSLSMEKFLVDLERAAQMSKDNEIVVWVHGYFNDFEDSIKGAAVLEANLKRPVIAYSWPSMKGTLPSKGSYRQSVGNAEWNQEAFTSFIRLLNARFPNRVVLVCHSMGSRLVAGALRDISTAGSACEFPEIAFASPDFDSHTFVNRYGEALKSAKRVRIYINPSDKALGKSEDLWGGHSRVGRPGDLVGVLTQLPNTEVIDFTAYGAGFMGHDVPVSLLSNLHSMGRPGKGWLLQAQPLKLIRANP